MSTLEQLKSDVARLTSELDAKEKAFAEKQAAATICAQETETEVLDFFHKQQAEIERTKLEKIQALNEAFANKCAELQNAIAAESRELTYAAWDAEIWASFDIHIHRPAHEITRLGAFEVSTENGSLVIPATFPILGGKNVLVQAKGSGRQSARQLLRNVAFRLLASLPPGKLRFSFIDPVELGSTAAGLIGAMPDFLTGGSAWHEEQDVQDQLSRIETRIAAIKTKYLGIKFQSIEEYNNQAGTIEEPYWLLVIADCPVRFRRESLQKLLSIAKNGPRTGVYLAVMLDDAQKECDEFLVSELAATAHHIVCPDQHTPIFFNDPEFREVKLIIDAPPPMQLSVHITDQVSRTAAGAQNVKVDWEAPIPENWWNEDSRHGLRIPIGTYGACQTQVFEIDEKLLYSALVVGKPGSGKSRLLHVLICGLATRYSPEEVSLYLLDCKQVEFKDYATFHLPHARVVAIESEREFGLSVLRRLNSELDARKNTFSSVGETSLSSFRTKTKTALPRIVVIIDEFQELLQDDPLGGEAAGILDRLVRQGRAFGINVILASQTLSGLTAMRQSTRHQIPIRIVLQCSQSDSSFALSQENDDARLLERPGEAIFNSANGRREGNNRFQVSWLSDEALESVLGKICARAVSSGFRTAEPPVIFDGNSLADIRQNTALVAVLNTCKDSIKLGQTTSAWLGEPIEMKDSTAAVFKRQSRSNLLVLGQSEYESQCMAMMLAAIASISVQRPSATTQFLIFNLSDPEADWSQLLKKCQDSFPHPLELVPRTQLAQKLTDLTDLLEFRTSEPTGALSTSIFLFILGLHRERSLRRSEFGSNYSGLTPTKAPKILTSAEHLSTICREGPPYGIHCLIWCDTVASFERVFQRKGIEQFSLRVGLQMSEPDSRSLFDSEAATQLGSHRAIFFDDERPGHLERFRPYSLPNAEWISEVAKRQT